MSGPHFARLAALAEKRFVPFSVTFEVSLACNLRCMHCYNFDRELRHHPDPVRRDALSAAEIHRVVDEVREEGTLFLAFTGGEPTSHPAIVDFVAHASTAGMFTRLKSNGTQFTAARISQLKKAGLKAVDVSVYGATADLHDAFVRLPGAFDRTIAGIRQSREAGLGVHIAFIVTGLNASSVAAMAELAEGLGISYGFDTHITARHDGSDSSRSLSVDRSTLEQLWRGPFAQYRRDGRPVGRIACPCARSVCGIGSSGDVYPCIGAPLPAGNLRAASFRQIWRHSPTLQRIRGLRNEDFRACSSCSHLPYCHRSSGVMLNNTGNFTGPSQFGDDLCCTEAEVVHQIVDELRSTHPPGFGEKTTAI